MTITFLGTSSCRFDAHDDTVHYLINDSIMVDTGWFAVANLRNLGIDPLSVKHLLFTHLHHDHYLGLPGFLFHLKCYRAWTNTTVYGPADDVEQVVRLSESLLQKDRFYADTPTVPIVPLDATGTLALDSLEVRYVKAIHPVDARSYVFTDGSGARIGISGDTAYNPQLVQLFAGCDVLVHEASFGPKAADPTDNPALHSGAPDAARIAAQAGVKRLVLVHGTREQRAASLESARAEFDGDVIWPEPGQKIKI